MVETTATRGGASDWISQSASLAAGMVMLIRSTKSRSIKRRRWRLSVEKQRNKGKKINRRTQRFEILIGVLDGAKEFRSSFLATHFKIEFYPREQLIHVNNFDFTLISKLFNNFNFIHVTIFSFKISYFSDFVRLVNLVVFLLDFLCCKLLNPDYIIHLNEVTAIT